MINNKNIILDKDSYKNQVDLFEKKAKEIKDSLFYMTKTMSEIDGKNDNWKSKVGVAVHNGYMEDEQKFKGIEEQLDKYVKFLRETLENYNEEETKQGKSIDDQKNNLDVNE